MIIKSSKDFRNQKAKGRGLVKKGKEAGAKLNLQKVMLRKN